MNADTEVARSLHAWSEVLMHHSMYEFKKIMDANGLSPSQMITLFHLYHGDTCNISAIGSQLGVSNAASSQLIDRLVVQGFVQRIEDPTDRRVKQIRITDLGKALVEQGISARLTWMEDILTELTSEQQAIVISALSMLTLRASKM